MDIRCWNDFSLQKRNSGINRDNSAEIISLRIISIGIIISCYIYFKYLFKSTTGLIEHRNLNYIFPLTSALFAFVNNANDIAHYIYHPKDCYIFYTIFRSSASLKWPPISWLQTFRLSLTSRIYLSKWKFYYVTIISIIFSTLYCLCYFLNLNQFTYTEVEFTGCGVANDSKYIYHVMAFDIIDSFFSLGAICVIIYNAVKNLRELNTKNEKLNNLVSEGLLELIVITLAKIIIYPLIAMTSYQPSFDVFWDILSVIVISCSYRMVNFPYQCNPKEKCFGRKLFGYVETRVNHVKNMMPRYSHDDDNNSTTYSLNKSDSITYHSNSIIVIDEKRENPNLKGISI